MSFNRTQSAQSKTLSLLGIAGLILVTGACSRTTGATGAESEIAYVQGSKVGTALSESPLQAYDDMIWGTSDQGDHMRLMVAEHSHREQLIAQCMRDQGFEYRPHTVDIIFDDARLWDPDNREWVSNYGYAIVNKPWQEVVTPNPNDDIIASLTESEHTAYQNALFGPPRTEQGFAGFETMGCYGWAWEEAAANRLWGANSDEFAPLREAINRFRGDLNAETTDADRDWAECMADAGFPGFSRQRDAQDHLLNEFTTLFGTTPDPISSARSASFSDREIEVALIDLACREETNFTIRQNAIRWEAEAQFVTDHRTALDALRSAYEQRS